MKSGIYKIVNTANGKAYIGSSFVLTRRWNRHVRELRGGIHPNAKLQAAWSKYGETSFEFCVVEYVDESLLIEREQHWIDCESPEYNICRTAGNTAGVRPDAAAREKMAAAKRGKPRSLETRQKISAYQKTRVVSPETIKKQSIARTGAKRSAEARQRMSDAAKGRVLSQAHRAAIAASVKAAIAMKRASERQSA